METFVFSRPGGNWDIRLFSLTSLAIVLPATTVPVTCYSAQAKAAGQVVEISGRVIDEQGNGVPDVRVARVWSVEQSSWRAKHGDEASARTGEDGSFTLTLEVAGERSVAIMAMDAHAARGATAETVSDPLVLKLRPLSHVRAAVVSKATRNSLPIVWSLHLSESGPRIADGRAENGRLDFPLPRGRYYLAIESEGHQTSVVRLSVGRRGAELGAVALSPALLAQLHGDLAPEIHVTSVSGLPEGVGLADLRGKWILIDFWGYWCEPCVRGMPKLIEFWDDHADRRSQFEILAFHDATVDSLEELQTKVASAREEYWMNRELPFPVLVDSAGETLERFGVLRFPTLVLIDPEGRIVDSTSGDGSRLLERLANDLR
jgi:thiol-disulfide isomerase/thioredoxin